MSTGRFRSTVCAATGALVASVLVSMAGATTITNQFAFHGPFLSEENVEGIAISAVSGNGFVTVTATGGLINGTATENDLVDVIRGDWGLGVLNATVPAGQDRSTLFQRIHVDGSNRPEVLRLEFSDLVRIDELFLSYVGPFESFDLSVDGVGIDLMAEFGTTEIYQMAPHGTAPGTVMFSDSVPFGRVWEFFAASSTDEWNIEGLSVSVVPSPSTSLGLIGLALTGCALHVVRRRKPTPRK